MACQMAARRSCLVLEMEQLEMEMGLLEMEIEMVQLGLLVSQSALHRYQRQLCMP